MEENVEVSKRSVAKKSIYSISLAAIYLAMAVVLESISKFVPFLSFANGGSISLTMVPLVLAALSLGPIWGFGVGLLFALINICMDGAWSWGWQSWILDYFVAFPIVFVSGFFRKYYYKNKTWSLVVGMLVFGVLRFISHFISGCFIFKSDPSQSALSKVNIIFSLGYNSGYIIPSVSLGIIVLLILAKPLFSLNNTVMMKTLNPNKDKEVNNSTMNDLLDFSLFVIFVVTLLMGIFGSTPLIYSKSDDGIAFLGYHYLGYFGLVFAIVAFVFALLAFIKSNKYDELNIRKKFFKQRKYYYLTIMILLLVSMAINCLSIASFYTYAYDLYHQTSNVELLLK